MRRLCHAPGLLCLVGAIPMVAWAGVPAIASPSAVAPANRSIPVVEQFMEPAAAVAAILDIADQRIALMSDVAAVKWLQQTPVADPAREQAVVEVASATAAQRGLEPPGVRALYELQIALARDAQSALHERWRRTGYDGSAAPPDLQREIRPRIDALGAQFLDALVLAAPILEAGRLGERFPGLAEQHLRDPFWTAATRAALLDALGAVRRAAAPPLPRIRNAGVLRVGTTGDYEPWSLAADGVLRGADIGLARAIAGRLGLRVVFVHTSWSTLLEDLLAQRFDIAIGGISVTAERARSAAFSIPYATGGKTILARCTEARRFRTLAALDRDGVRLVVNPGGTNQQFVSEHIHHASVSVLPDNFSVFEALLHGSGDAMITDDAEVDVQTRRHPELCRTSPRLLTRADKAVLLPRDVELQAAINGALRAEIAAGNPARLQREFLLRP